MIDAVLAAALLLATPAGADPTALAPAPVAQAPRETPPPAADVGGPGQAAQEEDNGTDILVTGRDRPPPEDPLERLNLVSYEMTQAVDVALIRPASKTYQRLLPNPVRDGIRNAINNLREPVAFVNFLLQLKPGKAIETVGRFALNSTVGVAGLFDIAKRRPFHLPRRPNGLSNTLGYYGVKTGAFLFLPLIGPTTVRDFIGDGLDRLILPLGVGKPFNRPAYAISIYAASSLDQRAEFDEKLEAQHGSVDPYRTVREDYLRGRQAAIDALHGKKPAPLPAPAEEGDADPVKP